MFIIINTLTQNHPEHIKLTDIGVSKEIISILVIILNTHKNGTLPLKDKSKMWRIFSVLTKESSGPKRICKLLKKHYLNWTFSFSLLNFILLAQANLLFTLRCLKGKCHFDNIRLWPEECNVTEINIKYSKMYKVTLNIIVI